MAIRIVQHVQHSSYEKLDEVGIWKRNFCLWQGIASKFTKTLCYILSHKLGWSPDASGQVLGLIFLKPGGTFAFPRRQQHVIPWCPVSSTFCIQEGWKLPGNGGWEGWSNVTRVEVSHDLAQLDHWINKLPVQLTSYGSYKGIESLDDPFFPKLHVFFVAGPPSDQHCSGANGGRQHVLWCTSCKGIRYCERRWAQSHKG